MRSTHMAQWAPLLAVPGATFYSFQFEAAAAQLGEPVGNGIVDLAPELGDWSRTAAALAQMDLVIAVDSSLAHLAGAMHPPVWIPLQAAVEWRWGSRAQRPRGTPRPGCFVAAGSRVGAGVRSNGGGVAG